MNETEGPSLRDISRIRHQLITNEIPNNAKVLDAGCDDGALMALLETTRNADVRGIELLQSKVNECVARGLAVVQGDVDTDLEQYPSNAFDAVIMSQVVQATRDPKHVLLELLRIADRAIVSFPNFGYWRVRMSLSWGGRMPVTEKLPYSWYNTPNIHFCTIRDFLALCDEVNAHVEKMIVLDSDGYQIKETAPLAWKNFKGEQAMLVLTKR